METHEGSVLKVAEAAAATGVHVRTMYQWIERGLVETRFLPSGTTLVVMASVVKLSRPGAEPDPARTGGLGPSTAHLGESMNDVVEAR